MSRDVNITIGVTHELKRLIERILDAAEGKLSPADKALLDGLLAREASSVAKIEALDALTPSKT